MGPDEDMTVQQDLTPLPWPAAGRAVGRCVLRSTVMLAGGEVHLARDWVGRSIAFADGTVGRVYRETRVDAELLDPCVLTVCFRLRAVRGVGHRLFRWESLLNTPLFVGFSGFATKLWLAHDGTGRYRGLYEWDGPDQAQAYARALWRVLQLVSEPGSIRYHVLPGKHRADVLAGPAASPPTGPTAHERSPISGMGGSADDWWRVVAVR